MTIFKSRQVNLDPEPWVVEEQYGRQDHQVTPLYRFDPRPEFEPTRDPEPWECSNTRHAEWHECVDPRVSIPIWAPRREQFDTPVNPILVSLRDDIAGSADLSHVTKAHAEFWLSFIEEWAATPEQIVHARRVLSRLANFQDGDS